MVPALIHIKAQPPVQRGDGPIAIVLAPTRELTQQIQTVSEEFARESNLHCAALYGGASKGLQCRDLFRSGHCAEIVVACPGRFLDMIADGRINLRRLVLIRVHVCLSTQSFICTFPLVHAVPPIWCSTKQTVCWTWASSRRFARFWSKCDPTVRRSCGALRGPRRCNSWRATS